MALPKAEGQLCIYQQGKPYLLMIIFYITLKAIVCFLDQYSVIKFAFCSLYPILIIK